jgi:hypothetical protein
VVKKYAYSGDICKIHVKQCLHHRFTSDVVSQPLIIDAFKLNTILSFNALMSVSLHFFGGSKPTKISTAQNPNRVLTALQVKDLTLPLMP